MQNNSIFLNFPICALVSTAISFITPEIEACNIAYRIPQAEHTVLAEELFWTYHIDPKEFAFSKYFLL